MSHTHGSDYDLVIPMTFSNSWENFVRSSEIFGGCSPKVADMRWAVSGLILISSAAATISDKWLLMSWRSVESFRFKSSSCSAVIVTGP